MRRLIYIICIGVTALLALSCEKEFELKMEGKNIIKVECFPGVSDSVYIRVVPCIAINTNYDYSKFNPVVRLVVDGVNVPVWFDGQFYVGNYKVLPGNEVKVSVSADGFESVESVTVVPVHIQNMKIETEIYDTEETKVVEQEDGVNYNLRLNVKLTLDDPAESVDAYGIQFIREQIYYYNSPYESYVDTSYFYSSGVVNDMSNNPLLPQNSTVISIDFNGYTLNTYNSITMFMDKNFNGRTTTLEAENIYSEDFYYSGEATDADGNSFTYEGASMYRYKLRIYKMTSEFSRYAYAQHQIDDNVFAEIGLAPAGYAYSNITNGAGALAGVLMYETEWME